MTPLCAEMTWYRFVLHWISENGFAAFVVACCINYLIVRLVRGWPPPEPPESPS